MPQVMDGGSQLAGRGFGTWWQTFVQHPARRFQAGCPKAGIAVEQGDLDAARGRGQPRRMGQRRHARRPDRADHRVRRAQQVRQAILARSTASCCAADAFPIHARLVGDDLARYRDDQWLTVEGTVTPYSATKVNGYTPTLTVRSAQPIPAPAEPYEY
ncbi:TIGR03943 family putative permease subunit [Amycolatopsis roodepoortensis]|uniref:TIGR03943 family putative permease subunit n=1 Tax=Amycolatopsis roodepoortensis TaxID=700274 RepID=UPI0035308212